MKEAKTSEETKKNMSILKKTAVSSSSSEIVVQSISSRSRHRIVVDDGSPQATPEGRRGLNVDDKREDLP